MLSEFNLHTVLSLPESVFSPYTSMSANALFFDTTGAQISLNNDNLASEGQGEYE